MLRERLLPPSDSFPENPWALESVRLDQKVAEEYVGQQETMFALSNGYLGLRGTWDEGVPAYAPGVFLNGFYEYRPISYGEHAYGFPRRGQSILNCPDGTIVRLFVEDEPFIVTEAEVVSFRRSLDLKQGVVHRDVTWVTPAGHRMRLSTVRLVSFAHRHLAAIQYELSAQDAEVDVVIASELRQQQPLPEDPTDPRLAVGFVGRVLQPKGIFYDGSRAVLAYTTEGSRLILGCGMDHRLESASPFATETTCREDLATVAFSGRLRPGQPLRLQKYLSYHYSKGDDAEQIRSQVRWSLDRAVRTGFTGSWSVSARIFHGSGYTPISRSMLTTRDGSSLSAGTCSSSCRRQRAARGTVSPPAA